MNLRSNLSHRPILCHQILLMTHTNNMYSTVYGCFSALMQLWGLWGQIWFINFDGKCMKFWPVHIMYSKVIEIKDFFGFFILWWKRSQIRMSPKRPYFWIYTQNFLPRLKNNAKPCIRTCLWNGIFPFQPYFLLSSLLNYLLYSRLEKIF